MSFGLRYVFVEFWPDVLATDCSIQQRDPCFILTDVCLRHNEICTFFLFDDISDLRYSKGVEVVNATDFSSDVTSNRSSLSSISPSSEKARLQVGVHIGAWFVECKTVGGGFAFPRLSSC